MATIPVMLRSTIAPDTSVESPHILVEGSRDCRVRLNPVVMDFDDPSLRIQVSVLLSEDGGLTWPHETLAQIVGGARGKDGLMPSVGCGLVDRRTGQLVPFPKGMLAKVRYRHNMRRRMGLDLELI